MRLITVNVNGIRAAFRKGMGQWLADSGADIVCLQEVRAPIAESLDLIGEQWQAVIEPSRIKGRAGVGLLIRKDGAVTCEATRASLPAELYGEQGEPDVDSGRWLEADLTVDAADGPYRLTVISTYLHSGVAGDPKEEQKLAHLRLVDQRLQELASAAASGGPQAVMCGDFNIVRSAADIKNFRPNHNKSAGVLDEEIDFLNRWMGRDTQGDPRGVAGGAEVAGEAPWRDVLRLLQPSNPDQPGPYTWWSQRGQAFVNNVGWRIDYQMATPELASRARQWRIDRADSYESRWSDHAPLVIDYEL